MSNDFTVGKHRPVYLWAGPGTIRMNRLKFMNAAVDTAVHVEAHRAEGAQRMTAEAGFNWAYLTYDWGFPPEVAQEDWKSFAEAVNVYHDQGARVFGYVQTSNCVFDGSYRTKDWYALDPKGRKFYYYTGRYMTCWLHPGWVEHLKEMTRGVIQDGADGVFYDNPWCGAQPLHLNGAWLGPAGCYCERCRMAFHMATGLEIPTRLDTVNDEASQRYIRWRAQQVTRVLLQLADHARAQKSDVVVSVNDFDPVMRPSFLMLGVDLSRLAHVQDVMMLEDYGLPRLDGDTLVNNALTLRTARGLCGDTPISTIPYDKGIGFDGVYPPERLVMGMLEAAACGAPMVVKGSEYVEDKTFTLLTAKRFAPQREAIGEIHRWLEERADLYAGARRNVARLALLHPGDALWQQWDALAPRYFGAGQTLLAAGTPWRVVLPEQTQDVELLLTFGQRPPEEYAGRWVDVLTLPGWSKPRPQLLAQVSWLRPPATVVMQALYRGYFRSRLIRRLGDRLGMVHFFLQSPYFRLPSQAARQTLFDALAELPYPQVRPEVPALAEVWRRGDEEQIHLVNYTDQLQQVEIAFGRPVSGRVMRLSDPGAAFAGLEVTVPLNRYTVLVYKEI